MPSPRLPLPDWLRRLETLSPHDIELGLERVAEVLARMALAPPARTIVVGGTNGKGSTVEMLRALLSGDATVGTYTSPHVLRYNERVAVNGELASDDAIVAAFEQVEAARRDVPLTYFEFGTLAALAAFDSANVHTAILEVGLGGRLDAVNVVEPDASLITNVSLDHCEWLGDTLEKIGYEKAGIMRAGKPAVFAAPDMPASVAEQAASIGATLVRAGRDYSWTADGDARWSWRGRHIDLADLAVPVLAGPMQLQNAAGALALVEALGLPALLDVAHNPAAAAALAAGLQELDAVPAVAIVGILDDKDVEGVIEPLAPRVDNWIAVTASNPRAIDAAELARRVANATGKACLIADSPDMAIERARAMSAGGDCVLVTGSFFTVGPLLARLSARD